MKTVVSNFKLQYVGQKSYYTPKVQIVGRQAHNLPCGDGGGGGGGGGGGATWGLTEAVAGSALRLSNATFAARW